MKLSFHDYIGIAIHQADLRLTSYIKSRLDPYNIAPEQNLIMLLLWDQDGLTQSEIAEQLEKDKTNITRMICNLEEKGFIERVTSPHDRRSLKVYLTEKGKELGTHVIPIAETFNDIVCEGITEEELRMLREILNKMCKNVG
ncbi:MarR family winged helix-turn-helix transcriptional regulator [Ectobacillus ponti]|uniref:MarR family transcriptional regulator n=1 Tax=Ectobacillus ponti TaxID=2961894 RepID=A0AA42BPG7_9BACI|nr:MarR family transcriptional regulator [Ectobacillus ponti]MCP8968411.1 MarR family transcriptional regulator [Ectobacillus ponti]